MSKTIKILLLTVLSIFALTGATFASSYFTKIEVNLEPINLQVNDHMLKGDQFYNGKEHVPRTINFKGTTYMSIRELGEILNLNIVWDPRTKTIVISEQETAPLNPVSTVHEFTLQTEANLPTTIKNYIEAVKDTQGIYEKDGYYVIARGAVPNPGYGIQLIKQEQILEQLKVYVKLTKPNPDMMYTQGISFPYLVGKVDLPPYTTISFIDVDTGKTLFEKTGELPIR